MINFEDTQKELTELYKKKNKDYGDSFNESLNKYGLLPTVLRLTEKTKRLETLYLNNGSSSIKDENVDDTLKDIANYCIITLTWLKNKNLN